MKTQNTIEKNIDTSLLPPSFPRPLALDRIAKVLIATGIGMTAVEEIFKVIAEKDVPVEGTEINTEKEGEQLKEESDE